MPMSISSKTRVRGVGSFFLDLAAALFNRNFEGEHDAGHLAAGGDLVQRLQGLAGIGGNAVLDFIPAVRSPRALLLMTGNGDFESYFHGEGVDLCLGEVGELCRGAFAVLQRVTQRRRDKLPQLCRGSARSDLRISSRSSTSANLQRHLVAESDDIGNRLAVFAFQAIEQGEAIFDLSEAFGRSVDSLGVVAQRGAYIANRGACRFDLLRVLR